MIILKACGIITNFKIWFGVKPIEAAASFCPLLIPCIKALTHYAIKDAIASVGNYKVSTFINAPATPERILMSINRIKNKLENKNGR